MSNDGVETKNEETAAAAAAGGAGVRYERSFDGTVATIVLDRAAQRNAVDGATAEALFAAFRAFEEDERAKVAVLWGANGTFCAGADLKALAAKRNPNKVTPHGKGPMGPTRMQLRKPVIAAVAGYAVAGGLELACWCDLRVAEEDAVFGVFCRRWGVPLIDGGTVRLPRLIGHSRAMDLILTGRPCGAKEALHIGLANRVVPRGEARAEAEKLAAEIARFPQATMLSDRASACEQWALGETAAIQNELRHGAAVLEDAVKGATTFAGGAGRGGSFEDFKPKL
ncbi:Methylglutaconyl-CoA hydratase, mitochondrial [Hondaea fermentalgiana]|uniref:Methylglutaconyl-CoA hydratase, mitochondrial n=1 Tax=Hondaea fermentalgiana TaxID=2315210 RepID=A0A2R5G1R6_9STRA|nr:Methylglutaconyl-CoA hydratase, mitochondrial [Hondaea fermentalgiana]|eukprot:GBG24475.1 Methylglutaconyl-CoA hydratase, mitochondrial [Hondaea fermentalgiana]